MLNTLAEKGKLPEISKKIYLSILSKSIKEAKQILHAMQEMVRELHDLENEKKMDAENPATVFLDDVGEQDTLLEPQDDMYQERRHIPVNTQLLQSFRGRKHDIYESMEEAAYKIFNYSIFKLAVIFERVRLYEQSVIQPRDNILSILEVNLDTKNTNMTMEGQRMTRIWEKNDFIMTYRVTQIIYEEIKRLEGLNIQKNLFADDIKGPIA